uniref:DUF4116 domain-containing protein n=1 Tax=Pseudo-nitzschia australis TaxID=44445 RepID=A0A7S4EI05_9STRA
MGNALYFFLASNTPKNNEQETINAVTQNGQALEHASDELKNNERVVTTAVTQHGGALEHASDELKNNERVVTTAVTQEKQRAGCDYCRNTEWQGVGLCIP